ncbi:hypothetical protein TELCIR_04069 [Teladorsagia circumcincta]|uniref:Uncharacterized protein n=1 Tax=Teladorsagia circumcincta TaxID=45464 RepID=A0A2G9UUN4_TELCI|nr:hypothetical protein TELCIR_04069 [Teladorsagia circumcincta]
MFPDRARQKLEKRMEMLLQNAAPGHQKEMLPRCNPDIVPINTFIAKRMAKRRPPPKTYHTINLIAEVPGMSFPILTPTVPRRQLPQIPPNLLSPNRKQVYFEEASETTSMLM